ELHCVDAGATGGNSFAIGRLVILTTDEQDALTCQVVHVHGHDGEAGLSPTGFGTEHDNATGAVSADDLVELAVAGREILGFDLAAALLPNRLERLGHAAHAEALPCGRWGLGVVGHGRSVLARIVKVVAVWRRFGRLSLLRLPARLALHVDHIPSRHLGPVTRIARLVAEFLSDHGGEHRGL